MRTAISLIVLTSEGLLLTKKKKTWILPGGKPKEGESDKDCLIRKFKEELPDSKISITNYYRNFTGMTPYKKDLLENVVYFGTLTGSIKPSNEISKAKYITDFEDYNLSDITQKVVNSLKENKYLK